MSDPPYPPALPADPRAREVLDVWFGPLPRRDTLPLDKMPLWFTKNAETDRALRERFAGLRQAAVAGELEGWLRTARGRLAAIVLIDQFSRNLYRETAEAFAHDPRSRQWALDGIAQGQHRELAFVERLFFCLPLEHSEELADQQQFLALVEALQAEVPEALRSWADTLRDYAQRHLDIVARFGRFPHRNMALGRPSTPEETAFLAEPNSSF